MKIALNHTHTPYAAMLCAAFPEHAFFATGWTYPFRDVPENLTIFNYEEPMSLYVDVLIDDNFQKDTSSIVASRKVFLIHNEQNFGPESKAWIERIITSDYKSIVCVSEHKKWALRDFALDPRVRTILFSSAFPKRVVQPEIGKIGFVHNELTPEKVEFIEKVSPGFNCVVIGHTNDLYKGHKIVPTRFSEFLANFHGIDVLVNVVMGDAWGMTPMEAMASGIPVITGMSIDIPVQCISGWNCIHTSERAFRCIDEIRFWIGRLITDRDLNAEIGRNGQEMVLRHFSPDVFRSQWMEVLS